MKAKTVVSLTLVVLLLVVSFEIKGLTNLSSATLLVAFCISAYYFAMLQKPINGDQTMEHHRHDDEEMESIRGSALGATVELRGRKILSENKLGKKLSSQAMTNLMLAFLGIGLITHHVLTDGTNKKILEALEVQNFLNTQTEAKRLDYGKRMRIPKALSDQLRPNDP